MQTIRAMYEKRGQHATRFSILLDATLTENKLNN